MKQISPSVHETAFNCPHCDALAKQFWFSLEADSLPESNPLPKIIDAERRKKINFENAEDADERKTFSRWADKMAKGRPFLGKGKAKYYEFQGLFNMSVSQCFNCKDISIWIYDKLVYPKRGEAPPANPDLSEDIRRDYDEASTILDLSPRGAAAMIRLAIQKFCKELGQPGKNINEDIKMLVANGLDPRIQKALDVVRVIGNNAVHPGQIDLRDDRATAESLFGLLNLIAEKMISEPKHVDEVYAALPEGALKAIEERDAE